MDSRPAHFIVNMGVYIIRVEGKSRGKNKYTLRTNGTDKYDN